MFKLSYIKKYLLNKKILPNFQKKYYNNLKFNIKNKFLLFK